MGKWWVKIQGGIMQQSQRFHPHHKTIDDYDVTDAIRYQKNDMGALVLRIGIGGPMLFHGINKLFYGTEQVAMVLENVGIPVFFSFGVLLAEVIAPVMLILGFKVRLAAFLIAVDMFMATLLVHSTELFEVSNIGGWMVELNALYFFGALAILFFGSGKFAVTKGRGYLD
jgi:putative oxidoreductase